MGNNFANLNKDSYEKVHKLLSIMQFYVITESDTETRKAYKIVWNSMISYHEQELKKALEDMTSKPDINWITEIRNIQL
jgi:hypothetical protein